ncbi:hypothetical protein [Alterinioella nitratireducens]|uniref:hypothetical protein n=1 Tax=Alterinioella nitratireducens TaxID=2735915 RepID=UPI0015582F3F|nr:hypothetical protein [Alterinioella nitratireducens]NPD20564.1 hypothetical protein [Alterinioella nitratireducens]
MQRAVENRPDLLQPAALGPIDWLSPRAEDEHAEYRDAAFLSLLGLDHLAEPLSRFWPKRGPQWDALGRAGDSVVLVEAKAHIPEFFSSPTQSSGRSRTLIESSLNQCKQRLGVAEDRNWMLHFYQYANRLAHLIWLRDQGVDAHLMLVGFLGDVDCSGPTSPEAWHAMYQTAEHVMGIPQRHAYRRYIHHLTPDVANLA